MKYVLLTYKRYGAASVLVSTVEYTSAPAVIAIVGANAAISASEPGHHFVEDADYTYQIVVKAP